MSDSRPISPPVKPPPPSKTIPNSRSLSRSPRNHSRNLTPPRQKRFRSRSPPSPPRKYSRSSRTPSRSPSNDPYHRRHRYYRHDRAYPSDRYDSYHRYDRYHPSDRHDRYHRYDRSDTFDLRSRYPDRERHIRRRYYSPKPRSPPYRYRPPSPDPHPLHDRHPSRDRNSYRPVFRDDAYRDRHYQPPRLRISDRSSSRSPRRRRERRRRDRRRRDRRPVSPSQRMPAEHVDKLFLEALKLVVKYRAPPFNISVISDHMTSINPKWSVRNTQYPTFSDLCRVQEARGHLVLARQGESVVMQSSKYQPDVLEVRPKDITRRRRSHNRDGDGAIHIDSTNRREWDLDERAEARKERFRFNGDKKHTTSTTNQQSKSSKENDIGEGATQEAAGNSWAEQSNAAPSDRGTDAAKRLKNADLNGPEATGATTMANADRGDSVRPDSQRTSPGACNGNHRSANAEALMEDKKVAGKTGLKRVPMKSQDEREETASEIVHPDVSAKKANDRAEKREEIPSDAEIKARKEQTNLPVN